VAAVVTPLDHVFGLAAAVEADHVTVAATDVVEGLTVIVFFIVAHSSGAASRKQSHHQGKCRQSKNIHRASVLSGLSD